MKNKWLIFLALFIGGLLLYMAVYLMASHSTAYKFVEQELRDSKELQAKVGKIEKIRLEPFGAYEAKSVGENEFVSMEVKVFGERKTLLLNIEAKKTDGTWKMITTGE